MTPGYTIRSLWIPADDIAAVPHLVDSNAPMSERKSVEEIARYFRREFRFDFVQFSAHEKMDDSAAYLWTTASLADMRRGRVVYGIIGACCFRYRKYTDAPHGWALQWIWFHPYERRRGHLTQAWPLFRELYGDFNVEGPLSDGMAAFLAAQDKVSK